MNFKTKPFEHQRRAYERFVDKPYGALLLEQGLGKTKIMLDILGNQRIGRVLVLAPNGLHANWYHKELPEHYPCIEAPKCYLWRGPATTMKARQELDEFLRQDPACPQFLFMNIEAIRTRKGFELAQAYLLASAGATTAETCLIIDESSCIKNPKAQVTKAAMKLGGWADRRFILSGTPMTQGPLDMFSQLKFLHDTAPFYRTWTAFKSAFAIQETCYAGSRSFQKITGFRNLERLSEIMSPTCLRLTKEECLDLPEKRWQQIHVDMKPEQAKAYEEMRSHAFSELTSGAIVSSTIPLTTIMKLQQICSGFVTDDEGIEHELPCGKLPALMQIAENTKPLVIFCAFRRNVSQVLNALADAYGPDKVVGYYGGMKQAERTEAIQKFQDGRADFIVCTSAGARGITLTRASTMVYFSNTYALDTRLQSQDRIHRIGQEQKCLYIDLTTPGTVDQRILEALTRKEDITKLVLTELIEFVR